MSKNEFSFLFNNFISALLSIPEKSDYALPELKKILVVRQHNQLGDLLAGTPFFRALKERFPDSSITLIVSPDNIAGVKKNKYIDDIILFDKQKLFNPFHFLAFLKKLRRIYDAVFVPVVVSISFTSNLLARISNSTLRIGPGRLNEIINEFSFLFNYRIDLDWTKTPDLHVGYQILEMLKPFGITTNDITPEITFDERDLQTARDFISMNNRERKEIVIGIHPGAGKPPNRWSVDNFVSLVKDLTKHYDPFIYLTGSVADMEQIQEFKELPVRPALFFNKPISQIAALIAQSQLFITNDTGIMHVAGATRTSQISLFGPTNPHNWAPIGENKIFIKNSDSINDITPDYVFSIAEKLLHICLPQKNLFESF